MEKHYQCRCCGLLQAIGQKAPNVEQLRALFPLISDLGAAIAIIGSIPTICPDTEEESRE